MYEQTDRPIKLTTPLGANALLLVGLRRRHEIMRPDLRPADQPSSGSRCDVTSQDIIGRPFRPTLVVGVDKMARRLREAKVLLGLQSCHRLPIWQTSPLLTKS